MISMWVCMMSCVCTTHAVNNLCLFHAMYSSCTNILEYYNDNHDYIQYYSCKTFNDIYYHDVKET